MEGGFKPSLRPTSCHPRGISHGDANFLITPEIGFLALCAIKKGEHFPLLFKFIPDPIKSQYRISAIIMVPVKPRIFRGTVKRNISLVYQKFGAG